MMATSCQHCGANVSSAHACEAYDHVEIAEIKPDITRVTLFDHWDRILRCERCR
jgi:hypothetical protein